MKKVNQDVDGIYRQILKSLDEKSGSERILYLRHRLGKSTTEIKDAQQHIINAERRGAIVSARMVRQALKVKQEIHRRLCDELDRCLAA